VSAGPHASVGFTDDDEHPPAVRFAKPGYVVHVRFDQLTILVLPATARELRDQLAALDLGGASL
jgi:hypothetical protein